jgi:hypothetical protein
VFAWSCTTVHLSLSPTETSPWRLEVFGHGDDGGHHQFKPRITYATIFQ